MVLCVVAALLVRSARDEPGPPAPAPVAADYPFGPRSVWRTDLSDAPVDPRSAAMVADLERQVADHWGGVASFNVDKYTASWWTAGPDTPRVDVAFDDCQRKGSVPAGLLGEGGQFTDVPIPAGAAPSPGTDGQLTIHSPSTDQLWELWRVERTASGWSACWGGRLDRVSASPGWFEDGFGASASGLAMSAGTVWVDDVRRGEINHALGLAILQPADWTRVRWPAQRSDGNDRDADALPEGTRLRLDPAVDVDALELTPLARLVARSAQTYGFVVTDQAGAVNIGAQTGQPLEDDPGFWDRTMAGVPSYQVLAGFPWDRLQVVAEDHGRPAGG
ncbi:hypothetical protein GTR02_06830 [Kineococcus sp. R8]|nr:hypothetical protein [Kineococcus siccus]